MVPGYDGKHDVGRVGDDGIVRVDPDQRGAAVALTGTDLDGRRLDLAAYRGQPVVINIWGSWCGPCTREAPLLVAAAKDLSGTARFVGITSRDPGVNAPKAFVRDHDITYPSFFDPDGQALLAFRDVRAPTSTPQTIVLDARGRYAAAWGEVTSRATLVDLVDDVAAGK